MNSAPTIRSLAVIGSAGRGSDAPFVNRDLYAAMADALKTVIERISTVDRLVSGGAALADHLAVGFFVKGLVPQLSLHLPAMFSHSAACFVEPYKKSPGSITNYWHHQFSGKCGGRSLKALSTALARKECAQKVHFGFEQRNGGIALEADGVIAFTFGDGPALKPGGSWQTMGQCLDRGIPSWHVDLHTMEIHSPAAPYPAGAQAGFALTQPVG